MSDSIQTTVILDNQEFLFDAEISFGDAQREIKKKLESGRVVTEIFVNEKAIDLEEEGALENEKLKDIGTIRFKSREVGSLLKESMKLAPTICEALFQDCADIAELLHNSKMIEANERIAEFSSLIDWLLQMVSSLQSYGEGDFRQMTVGDGTALEVISRTDTLLKALHHELQMQNYESFRQILLNDFRPELSLWREMFVKADQEWIAKAIVH